MEKKTQEKPSAKTDETGGKKIATTLMKAATPTSAPARTSHVKKKPVTAIMNDAAAKSPAKTTAKTSPVKNVKTASVTLQKKSTKGVKKTTGKVTTKTASKTVKK